MLGTVDLQEMCELSRGPRTILNEQMGTSAWASATVAGVTYEYIPEKDMWWGRAAG